MATHNYLPNVARYLGTLSKHQGKAQAWLGCVACEAPADSPVPTFRIPPGMLARSLGNPGNGCIQHGNWLPYLPLTDDDAVIICTDGDVKMQRGFSPAEWDWLQGWQHGQVGIGPNEPKEGGDSMQNELVRIKPLLSPEEIWQRFYPHEPNAPPIGNAGCIVATRKTWVELWMHYLRRWLDTAPLFGHIAVQQWTINLAINECFQRIVLPQSFHTHGHWGYPGQPFDGWGEENTATYQGKPILFAHKTW